MSKQALLIIDYTNDFIDDHGALSCKQPGQILENEIVSLANQFLQQGDFIILPTDLHIKNDPYTVESKLFPPHNLANTWGRQFYGKLENWYQTNKDSNSVEVIDKSHYSSFCGTSLDLFLRERNITTLHLTGVCTDICVLHTAVDAYNLNYNLVIHKNAVGSFSPEGHLWALNHFKTCLGAQII
ncbi:isochorismatase [Lactobacillus iners DSM 13335]|uniref:Isochorismatase family protein n=1 Tax=Lactobacillus iners DSM 13335 TaxID=525328 RepID=C8PCB8_9LACO|nr:isochorismatase family cysteine hydrolase [Lactobacillus iners]EEW51850.1 isochorismatase family protein [Lactobacillus iners DSM 13335]KRL60093.1 isochorismatase [Lactobacillus iners DSM 13335]MDK8131929.1 isochorismatase family cysteine hydrolase [Lactobacillus iners]QGA00317.1 isochorismatase family protein [Lactobacillus iners]